jgi:D-alanyl-D-alanine carboxypeptidase
MKVVTAVNALSQLGPETVLRTQVLVGTDPAQLYLKGGGDPMLTTKSLENLATDTALGRDVAVPITVHVVETEQNERVLVSHVCVWQRRHLAGHCVFHVI